jgi:hypothetical protein
MIDAINEPIIPLMLRSFYYPAQREQISVISADWNPVRCQKVVTTSGWLKSLCVDTVPDDAYPIPGNLVPLSDKVRGKVAICDYHGRSMQGEGMYPLAVTPELKAVYIHHYIDTGHDRSEAERKWKKVEVIAPDDVWFPG